LVHFSRENLKIDSCLSSNIICKRRDVHQDTVKEKEIIVAQKHQFMTKNLDFQIQSQNVMHFSQLSPVPILSEVSHAVFCSKRKLRQLVNSKFVMDVWKSKMKKKMKILRS
jgi:hypothetical protein